MPNIPIPENPVVKIKYGKINLGVVNFLANNDFKLKDMFAPTRYKLQDSCLENWQSQCYKNLDKLEQVLDWCYINQIRLYEVPMNIFSKINSQEFHSKFTSEEYEWIVKLEPFTERLKEVGKKAYLYGIRLVIRTDFDCILGSVSTEHDQMARYQIIWMDNMFNSMIEGAKTVPEKDKKSMSVVDSVEDWSKN